MRFHPAPERTLEAFDRDGASLRSETKNKIDVQFREQGMPPERLRDFLHAVLIENNAPSSTRRDHVSPLDRLESRSLVTRADGEYSEGVLIERSLAFAAMNVTTIRFVPGVDLEVELAGHVLHLRPTWNGESHTPASVSLCLPDLSAPTAMQRMVDAFRAPVGKFRRWSGIG